MSDRSILPGSILPGSILPGSILPGYMAAGGEAPNLRIDATIVGPVVELRYASHGEAVRQLRLLRAALSSAPQPEAAPEIWADIERSLRAVIEDGHSAELDELDAQLLLDLMRTRASPAPQQPIEETDRKAPADTLLEAAHAFWDSEREAGMQGAVKWVQGEDGELVIFTRGEYRHQLLAAVSGPRDDEYRFSRHAPQHAVALAALVDGHGAFLDTSPEHVHETAKNEHERPKKQAEQPVAVQEAAAALLRWHLDNAEVHPCDHHNDAVRAANCIPEVQALFTALSAPAAPTDEPYDEPRPQATVGRYAHGRRAAEQAAPNSCKGAPGECAHNGACMYACGATVSLADIDAIIYGMAGQARYIIDKALAAAAPVAAGTPGAELLRLADEWTQCADIADKTMTGPRYIGEAIAMRGCAKEIRELAARNAQGKGEPK